MKILMILRRPDEGFEEPSDVANLFNIKVVRRFFDFYFGFTSEAARTYGIYEYNLSNEPDQEFWVIVDETEETEGEEDEPES